jgi:hypothetical protein
MAPDDGSEPGDAEATFIEGNPLGAQRRDDRIDQIERRPRAPFAGGGNLRGHISRVVYHRQRQGNTNLWRGQSDPDPGQVGVHGVEQFVEQTVGKLPVVGFGSLSQERLAHLGDAPRAGSRQDQPNLFDESGIGRAHTPSGQRAQPAASAVLFTRPDPSAARSVTPGVAVSGGPQPVGAVRGVAPTVRANGVFAAGARRVKLVQWQMTSSS